MPMSSSGSPSCTQLLTWLQPRVTHHLLWFSNLLGQLTEPGKQLSYYCLLITKNVLKDNHLRRYLGWSLEGPKLESLCACGVGVCHHLGTWIYSSTWKLFKPCILGIFMEVSSHTNDRLLSSFPAPLLSLENGGGVQSSKLLTMVWSFWCPDLSGSHPESLH